MAHPGGRPTKYEGDITVQKAYDYLNSCVDTESEFHKTRGTSSDTFERVLDVKLPMVEGLSSYLGVNIDTINEWTKKYPEFSGAVEDLKKEQKRKLAEGGISGKYNASMAKFILSANHGMREGKDVTTNGKDIPQPLMDV